MSRGRPKEFDEDEALARALEIFWSNGFAGTAIADLTEGMGIGRQSLYDTFGDKRGLFLRALRAYCSQQHGVLSGVLAGPGSPAERLSAFLDLWVEMLTGPMRQGCMILNSIGEFVGAEDQEVLDEMHQEMERMHGLVEAVIRAAIADGSLDSALDAREVTLTLVATANGLSTQARLSDAADSARAATRTFKRLLGL